MYVNNISKIIYSAFVGYVIVTRITAIDSVGDPPLPIPNREVKPDSADGTANVCGRVGHRHFYKKDIQTGCLFFIYKRQCPPLLLVPSVWRPARHELRPCCVRPIAAGTNEPAL